MTDQISADPLTVSHWGAYRVQTEGGRVTGVTAFEGDPEPSPMIQAMPDVVHADCRIERPMVRKGWLETGRRRVVVRDAEPSRSSRCRGKRRWILSRRSWTACGPTTATRRFSARPAGAVPDRSIPRKHN